MNTRIKRHIRGLSLAILVLAAATTLSAEPAAPTGDEPLIPGAALVFSQESPPPLPVERRDSSYVRTSVIPVSGQGGPIRIRFERAVDLVSLRSSPSSLVVSVRRNDTGAPGSLVWQDMNELRFLPAPGGCKVGDYFSVRISGTVPLAEGGRKSVEEYKDFQVEEFQMGNKVSSTPVEKGKPRFVAFLDSNTRRIGSAPLYLLYDQAVDPEVMAPYISASCPGERLEIQVRRAESLAFDLAGLYDMTNVIAVSFSKLPPDGALVSIFYPLSFAGDSVSTASQSFEVFTDFRWDSGDISALKAGKAARLQSSWRLRLSSSFDPEAFLAAFSITPTPPALDVDFGYGSEIYISAKFDVGKLYSIKLAPTFSDFIGNKLKEPLNFAFKSQDLPPVLELPAYTLLLETGSNRLPVKFRNLKSIQVLTYKFASAGEFIAALSSKNDPQSYGLEALPPLTVQPSDTTMNSLFRSEFGIGTENGLKLVEVRATGRGSESPGSVSGTVLLQTSKLGISAKVSDGAIFAWVTSLDTAAPVNGAALKLYSADGRLLGSALTASDGTASIRSSAAKGSELEAPLFLSAERGADIAICRLENGELSGAWQFDLPGAVKGSNPLAAALFTERGAYRPGETVHIKAFIRSLPEYGAETTVTCSIHDPRGQEVFNKSARLDAYRGASWDFATAVGAAVGDYSVNLMLGDYYRGATFHVEEYRVPTFQVALSDSGMNWTNDGEVIVKATATYLKGGVLAGQPVNWRVYRQPADFSPPGFPGYVFCLERDLSTAGTVLDEGGSLDSKGEASLSFTPSQPDSYGPMNYIAQASVTDSDQQNYAGRITRLVHATDLYVGLRPPSRGIFHSGDSISFPALVTDIAGTPVAGRTVRVLLETLHYEQNTMLDESESATTYNREVVSTKDLGSFDSEILPRDYSFVVDKAGYYRLRLETLDQRGRAASTAFSFTASGGESVAWPRFDRERIDLVLDKKSYVAGDTATVIAQTPFKEARGLLTVEANGVLDSYPFMIKGDTPSVSFPVKAGYAPNAYVSVILVRGRSHYAKDATGFETGAPAYRIGYARLEVDPAAQRLDISIAPEKLIASPGGQVQLSFAVANANGAPSDASATVMVVDEAVLGLTAYATPDPIALAYAFRVLSVRNASNLLDLPYSRRSRFEKMFPGGDSDLSATLPVSDDLLRKLFKSTAFFAPAVPIGPDGRGSVSFKLPDNLTTYRVMVVAANKKGQMGSTQTPLLTRKAFAVEPVMPRFVYEGDELVVQARVFNATASAGSATVKAAFSGLELVDASDQAGQAKVAAGGSASLGYRVKVSAGAKTAKVRYLATMGSLADAVEYSIPIRVKGDKQTKTANAIIAGTGAVELKLPALHSPGTVEIVLSQTPLSELKDSVQYLMGYPNGCIEQTTSTAYPLVVLKDLLPAIGIDVNMADLKAYSEAGVARILSFQTKQGGLSYWPGGTEPHAFATAFGLTALIEAKKRGYNVPDAALKGMGDYLEYALATGKITGEMPHAAIADGDTRALFVMTLGRLGRPQSGYIKALWEKKDALTPFGLAFLAIAVKESKGSEALLEPVLAEIRKASIRAKGEAYFDAQAKGGWSFDSPLRTDAGALNAYAIAGVDPAMSQDLLRGLLKRREGGLWGNTQENVFGIMGIYDLVTASKAEDSSASSGPGLSVTVNGKRFTEQNFEKNSLGVLRLSLPESSLGPAVGSLRVEVSSPTGASVYATLRATYDLPVDEAFLSPRSEGFSYSRHFETMEGANLDGQVIPLGSLVRVRLQVRNESSRHYVAVDDMLPAGFEPLNEKLATTQSIDKGPASELEIKAKAVTSYSEMRDHRVAFYADELSAGDYEFDYIARATTEGDFYLPQGRVEAMYAPTEFATTGGGRVRVR